MTKISFCERKNIIRPSTLLHFKYEIDPYSGCEHHCYYCYALNDTTIDCDREIIVHRDYTRKLADELGIDNKTAKSYIDSYYDRYQGVARYKEEMVKSAREKGFVTTLFNRRRYLSEINSDKQRIRAEAERMAVNTPIQGTAADLIKKAMINIHGRLKQEGFQSKMLLQVHDELVFEVPEDEIETVSQMVKQEMEGVYKLDVPLKVDVSSGKNWDEAH